MPKIIPIGQRKCLKCGTLTSSRYNSDYGKWYHYLDGYQCGQCYLKSKKYNYCVYRKEWHRKLREFLIFQLGNKCVKCGFNDIRALEIDHIFGNGNTDRKRFNSTDRLLRYYIDNLDEAKAVLQILCANHHAIKVTEDKEQCRNKDNSGRKQIEI